jgi:hypothetical protein
MDCCRLATECDPASQPSPPVRPEKTGFSPYAVEGLQEACRRFESLHATQKSVYNENQSTKGLAMKNILFVVSLFSAALMAEPARAADYYVNNADASASDAGPGTETRPWANCPGMPGWSGTAVLQPGDRVYFHSAAQWTASGGPSLLVVEGGVTYDGSSWGDGTRALLRAEGQLDRPVIVIMADHADQATVVRGFEVDAGGHVNSGITVNWPQSSGNLTGAMKRIENCVVHDVASLSAEGQYEYGIAVSSGYGGGRTVSNVEVLGCTAYNISRGGINIYSANDDPLSRITDVVVRGCEVYNTGLDPDYAGSALPMKNHIQNVVFEYNYVHDTTRGMGIGVSSDSEEFRGPENAVIRHNIVARSAMMGINLNVKGDLSLDIYGNIIMGNGYQGIRFMDVQDTLAVRIYNNTLVHNYDPDWAHEILVATGSAVVSALEVKNNIFIALEGTLPLLDDEGSITDHSHNLFFREGGGTLVQAGGAGYTEADIASWEPTALAQDPQVNDVGNLPTGFAGTWGVDLRPDADGLAVAAESPARDSAADLGSAFATSINSVPRPRDEGWDRGAYEYSSVPPAEIDPVEPLPDAAVDDGAPEPADVSDVAADTADVPADAAGEDSDDGGDAGCGCTIP